MFTLPKSCRWVSSDERQYRLRVSQVGFKRFCHCLTPAVKRVKLKPSSKKPHSVAGQWVQSSSESSTESRIPALPSRMRTEQLVIDERCEVSGEYDGIMSGWSRMVEDSKTFEDVLFVGQHFGTFFHLFFCFSRKVKWGMWGPPRDGSEVIYASRASRAEHVLHASALLTLLGSLDEDLKASGDVTWFLLISWFDS